MKKNSWKRRILRVLSLLGDGSPSLLVGSISIVLLICIARAMGLWEGVELQTLDLLLRHRPTETADERITIVEITEADLQTLDTYPVPDDVVLQLLETLESYEPRVIGLDFLRNLSVMNPTKPVEQSIQAHKALLQQLKTASNVVVIERILKPLVPAPAGVPPENIGFADALIDRDGSVRQSLLASHGDADSETYHTSFTLQIATKYLAGEGLDPKNGNRDQYAMRFGQTELFRMKANSGGYHQQDTANNPVIMINFRQHPEPFRRISLGELIAKDFPPEWLTDQVVLVGITAETVKDYVNSSAVMPPPNSKDSTHNPSLIAGVDLQAHAISQILSAVLDNRPILSTWEAHWEYLWISFNGLMGLCLVHIKRRPIAHIAVIFIALGSTLLLIPISLLSAGIWIPLFPAWLCYSLTGSAVLGYRLYQYEQSRRIRFQERQQILERSYNAIHNGPLQTLKSLIRQVSSQEDVQIHAQLNAQSNIQSNAQSNAQSNTQSNIQTLSKEPDNPQITPTHTLHSWISELNKVDTELRNIYEFMQREYLQKEVTPQDSQIYLTQNYIIDLNEPLHELLHQVYQNKLQESKTYFETIKVKISDFCPMSAERLNATMKESILRFFEEALCNIEQHASGVTRLKVVCKQIHQENIIRVVDNGIVTDTAHNPMRKFTGGDGSRQANLLAKRLKGQFSRYDGTPTGTVCELVWPIAPRAFRAEKKGLLARFGK